MLVSITVRLNEAKGQWQVFDKVLGKGIRFDDTDDAKVDSSLLYLKISLVNILSDEKTYSIAVCTGTNTFLISIQVIPPG